MTDQRRDITPEFVNYTRDDLLAFILWLWQGFRFSPQEIADWKREYYQTRPLVPPVKKREGEDQ